MKKTWKNYEPGPPLVGPDYSIEGRPSIYFLKLVDHPYVKVGWATDWVARCREHQCGCPFNMEVILLVPGGANVETIAHYLFRGSRHRGEWFLFDKAFHERMAQVAAARGDIMVLNQTLDQVDEFNRQTHPWVGTAFHNIAEFSREFGIEWEIKHNMILEATA